MIIGTAQLVRINFNTNIQPLYTLGTNMVSEYLGTPTVHVELGPVSLTYEGERALRDYPREIGLAILDNPNQDLHRHIKTLIAQYGAASVAVALDEELSKR